MTQAFRARAGALGGLAAGVALLAAPLALAADPAANDALVALGPDGQPSSSLRPLDEGVLTPMDTSDAVKLSALPGYAVWNFSGGDPLTCLAQAVYFEARSESKAGQRAVAQVVINRTHLPQYASSVCGVVYQGAARATGCQFTFVCDGSLRDPSDLGAWDRAVGIAKDALAGYVDKPMLGATHYHAAWMTPYWASELRRIRRIGGQIFYH
ncbi:MAG: cell wall hydrolase [Caulobacteraceae bacterium]